MMGSKNIKNWELKHWTQHSEVQWDWGRVGVRFDRFQYSHVQEAREIQGTWIIFWSSKILKVRHQPVSRWFVSWLVLFWVFQCISKVTKEASQAIWLPLQEPSADEGAACHWSIGGLGDKTPADVFFFGFADSEVRVCAIMTHQNGLDIVGSPAPGSCTVRFYSWQDSSKETVAGSPEAGRIRAPFVRI